MTDTTELALRLKLEVHRAVSNFNPQMNIKTRDLKELVEALEKAQTINAAAEKLVRCKGRYHSEQNYRALAALFGVTTPDLPPLEHENVHYADAAEMEIAALRQRIAELEEAEQQLCAANVTLDARAELAERQLAELESRTVTVKLPTTRLWAGVTECYEKSNVIAAIRSAGMEVSDD
ncbi:ead/Ea22-like family protein [Klebsiella pneumoniae]|nr:ead/Ea22-like family protein [Klebsiella pneumoniae]MCD5925989.1 ead/Ea22-like family protein [Klebsiella pneumoniae]QLR67343.1 ead/Ea22-like family protein [Klebsiella pneumoniae]